MQRAINTRKSPRGAEIRKAEPQQVESSALVVNFLWEFFMTEVRTGGSGRGDGSTVRGVDRRECTGDIKYSVVPLPFIGPRSLHLLRRLKFLLRIFFFFFHRTRQVTCLDAICFTWPLHGSQSEWPREGLNVPFLNEYVYDLGSRKPPTEKGQRRGSRNEGPTKTYGRLPFTLSLFLPIFICPLLVWTRGLSPASECHSENRAEQ